MPKTGPVTFFQQVRNEMAKVTWPSRKETIQSTIAVFIMVTILSIFLFLADQLWAWIISLVLGIGS
jgi:preprotein translocase subunit SecE|tara:strand:- start:153 stop:350 length:198 start_codon:yes stop_codon:yes gene_type:complete